MSDKELLERVARLEAQVRALTWALWLIAVCALAAYLVRLHRPASRRPPVAEGPAAPPSVPPAPSPGTPYAPRTAGSGAGRPPSPEAPPGGAEAEKLVFPGFPDASPNPSR